MPYPMSNSITENVFSKQIEELVRDFVKSNLETMMREEFKNYFEVERPDLKNSKNGSYERILDTRFGRIEDLSVPRDREGHFQTCLFDPYQRRERWLGETIITMYNKGFSTREIGSFVERILGDSYSAATVSNVTNVLFEDIKQWQERPLNKRYSVLFLDGTYIKLRRQDVDSEVVYIVVGITEDGHKEIVDFFVGGNENSYGWKDILVGLKKRGLEEVLLGVFDGLPGLEGAFKEVYPKADVQRCIVHKIRNTTKKIRKSDQKKVTSDLKKVYRANTKNEALEEFKTFKETWNTIYPKVVTSWEEELSVLLTFLDYPKVIQPMIYTTNTIERTIKEVKKRTKTMNSLPSEKAVEKIIYLVAKDYNEKKSRVNEFRSAAEELNQMFEEKYEKTN